MFNSIKNQEKTDTQLLQKIDFISPLEITSCFVILSKWNLRRRTKGKISPLKTFIFTENGKAKKEVEDVNRLSPKTLVEN